MLFILTFPYSLQLYNFSANIIEQKKKPIESFNKKQVTRYMSLSDSVDELLTEAITACSLCALLASILAEPVCAFQRC